MSANQKLSPLLCQAKDEYVKQIADCMAPFVINVINMMYAAAKKNAGIGGSYIKDFQKKLREIPLWNQSMIDAQVVAITNKYKYMPELIAAVFVSYVKILSSVKIHSHKPHIQLKLPADDVFVHRVYITVAKSFYMDPGLVKSPRDVRLSVVRNAVENSVRELLPIEEILRAYLGTSVDSDGVKTDEIDEEEIDLSPSLEEEQKEEERKEETSPVSSISQTLSPVQALGDQVSAPSPIPSINLPIRSPEQVNSEAIARLKDLLHKTEPTSIPLSQPIPSPSQVAQQQPQVISVPRVAPGAFVSPVQAKGLGFDTPGDQFFS